MNVLSYDKVSKAIMDTEMHTKVFGLLLSLRMRRFLVYFCCCVMKNLLKQ